MHTYLPTYKYKLWQTMNDEKTQIEKKRRKKLDTNLNRGKTQIFTNHMLWQNKNCGRTKNVIKKIYIIDRANVEQNNDHENI